ncbi:hypothetical protein [Streptomyces sp. KE1]|uniref:hypothetical protein n=1 Tax=Streptomyces sp. KE1 TaxID=1638939 RepID=UPI000AFE9581|nr:hypothetical protein [Streptomyces sp. KE1]
MIQGSQSGPFPLPASLDIQQAWVEAGLKTEGVSIPREALLGLAPFVVDPESMLTERDRFGVRTWRRDALRTVKTDAGDMLVATVRMHGAGGSVWEHNERISSLWHSLVNPAPVPEGENAPSAVRPYTRQAADGVPQDFAAVESVVENRESLVANLEKAELGLREREGHRNYDLRQDLILNGQQEPCLYVAQHILIEEAPLQDREGNPLHPSEHWQWMAVRGNNRTQRRHEIFGISSADVVAGVPVKKIGGGGEAISFDPNEWLERLSNLLNAEHAALPDGASDVGAIDDFRAGRASRVAVVESQLVVGCSIPRRLYRIVQMSNRRDHVHTPLEFTPNDRARALGRSVLGTYVADGVLSENVEEVLSGSLPITGLQGLPADAKVSELRDIRSMMLFRELFPMDRQKRLLVRRVLSESPPSQLSSAEANQRARIWSAMTSESFPSPWNPRIAEVFQLAEVRVGLSPSERRLPELLAQADTDDEAFEELIVYRAAHWLAAYDIIDADRGSLTGQKTDDEGIKADRVRRTVKNNLMAMRNHRRKAVGVLRELATAMDEGDRRPRKVSDSGETLVEPMSKAWFNREFPKEAGTRARRVPKPRGGSAAPGPTEQAVRLAADNRAPALRGEERTAHVAENGRARHPEVAPARSAPGRAELPGLESVPATEPKPAAAAAELEQRVGALTQGVRKCAELVATLAVATESGGHSLTREQADSIALGLMAVEVEIRRSRVKLEGLAEPLMGP